MPEQPDRLHGSARGRGTGLVDVVDLEDALLRRCAGDHAGDRARSSARPDGISLVWHPDSPDEACCRAARSRSIVRLLTSKRPASQRTLRALGAAERNSSTNAYVRSVLFMLAPGLVRPPVHSIASRSDTSPRREGGVAVRAP